MNELKKYQFPNTQTLVLCGGQSNRMGTDKSLLRYFDKPQRYYVYEMLMPYCDRVFISCNSGQALTVAPGYQCIPDDAIFSDMGPMGALLTAFTKYPDKHILLIGCDYPFLQVTELETFSTQCRDIPVSFYNTEADVYESMIAWYPYTCFEELKHMFDAKQFSLQHLLRKTNAVKYIPSSKSSITSIDTREAYEQACKLLNTT
jgi:molybdopterin-guanine dinucleotide biosynthesis protein A